MAEKKLNVILDIDDVVLNWLDGFKNWLADDQGIIMAIPPTGLRYSAIEQCFQDVSRSEVFRLISEFSRSPSFAHLQPYPGTRSFITAISDAGLNINALSACGDGITADLRRAGLVEYLGWREDWPFRALPLGSSKFDALKNGFASGTGIMIDDHHGHVMSARRAGLDAIWHRSNAHIAFCPVEDKSFNETPTTSWDECGARLTAIVRTISPETATALSESLTRSNTPAPRTLTAAPAPVRTFEAAAMRSPSGPL